MASGPLTSSENLALNQLASRRQQIRTRAGLDAHGVKVLDVHHPERLVEIPAFPLHQSFHCFPPIGIGGLKLKLHRACIGKLFESSEAVLDAEEIYALAKEMA